MQLGIYEKALPKHFSFEEKIKFAKKLGFNFIEISVDESDERLARLNWENDEINLLRKQLNDNEMRIPTMTFSGHRRYPMGHPDKNIRDISMDLMKKAIILADKLGIRIVQLAGYDVYYVESTKETELLFIENLKKAVKLAQEYNVCLAIEIMDHPFINSITKYLKIANLIRSPYLKVYPDLGNLNAWPENIAENELEIGINTREIVAIHVKDTLNVEPNFPGKFKEVPFGSGHVNFESLFSKLYSLEYTGPFLIEMWTEKLENVDEIEKEVLSAKEFVLDKMRKGGYQC